VEAAKMTLINFYCKYCNHKEKVLLTDLELTPDNSQVEGVCEDCFERFQGKTDEDISYPGVPCPPEISAMIAELWKHERKKIRGLIRRMGTPHPESAPSGGESK
jgi:hypothetical protein